MLQKNFVYIIFSQKDGRFFYGHTYHPQRTLLAHNKGLSEYTKNFRPWKLFATKVVENRSTAIRMDMELKKMRKKDEFLKYIITNDFEIDEGK